MKVYQQQSIRNTTNPPIVGQKMLCKELNRKPIIKNDSQVSVAIELSKALQGFWSAYFFLKLQKRKF